MCRHKKSSLNSGKLTKKYGKMQNTRRSYHQNQSSTGDIDEPSSYPFELAEVLVLWRHITKHCFTTLLKAITPLHDMHSMFLHLINTDLPPQINGMKHCVSVNIAGNFLDHPKLTNDTIWCMYLYQVETYKRHHCRPHCPPYNVPRQKVLEFSFIRLPHHLQQPKNKYATHQTTMFIFQSSPNVYLVPEHVEQGIFIPGLATLKLFALDTCP